MLTGLLISGKSTEKSTMFVKGYPAEDHFPPSKKCLSKLNKKKADGMDGAPLSCVSCMRHSEYSFLKARKNEETFGLDRPKGPFTSFGPKNICNNSGSGPVPIINSTHGLHLENGLSWVVEYQQI